MPDSTDTFFVSTSHGLELTWRDPLAAFAPLAEDRYALLLLSGPGGRHSMIAAAPRRRYEGTGREPLMRARRAWRRARTVGSGEGAFAGGLAGLLSYELGHAVESVPRPSRASEWPDVALGLYPAAAIFDHATRRLTIEGEPQAAARLAARLGSGAVELPFRPARPPRVRAHRTRRRMEDAIARAVELIHRGDIYQVNLSQRFAARLGSADTPFAVFRRLAQASPAPFAAFFRLDPDRAVITHSPERFLRVWSDGRVESRPIKGTRPRAADPARDALNAAALLASEKDRAENLMIVDLVRNDLSRVCVPGSVRAPRLFGLESFANVHHLVSTVAGRLADGRDVFDLIAAAFPAGSITGAPKVRAMEIIAETEGEPRGPYCGALGYIGFNGAADWNVMIRTVAFVRAQGAWRARYRAGAGIVADSDPVAEYDEILAKAAALRAAVQGRGP